MQTSWLKAWRRHQLIKSGLVILCTLICIKTLFYVMGLVLPLMPEPIGSRADLFSEGANQTFRLTLSAGAIGLLIGLILGLAKLSKSKLIYLPAASIVGILRGTPLLVQIFFVYYALPTLLPFLRLNEFFAALVALSLNIGAYHAEVIRAGILSIPKGQSEAALSLGLSQWQTMRWVILPQAFKQMIPPLMNNLVALLKDSSLASSIGLLELSLVGNRITSETFLPVPVLITVSAIYLLQTMTLSVVVLFLDQRLK